MGVQYRCKNDRRRTAVRDRKGSAGRPLLNGIDYLEVLPGQTEDTAELVVHFLHHLPGTSPTIDTVPDATPLSRANVIIEGGGGAVRLGVAAVAIGMTDGVPDGLKLKVTVRSPGDLPSYTLRIVRSIVDRRPPDGVDPQLSEVIFCFQSGAGLDCLSPPAAAAAPPAEPQIDYLAKDYTSFRRLMLDRLTVLMPDWTERSPADIGVVLVELLAQAGDHLSYYQDAVSTEAYLGTARSRISMRRHARLLDYSMHDGCNARAWIFFEVGEQADGRTLPGPSADRERPYGTRVLTRVDGSAVLGPAALVPAVAAGASVFELLHGLTLYQAHNEIPLYTWGDGGCYLPQGATGVTLVNRGDSLHLAAGDVLIFEEVRGAESGLPEDADLTHRHVVRLTRVEDTQDPLVSEDEEGTQPLRLKNVEWSSEDALPFPLCLCEVPQDGELPPDQRRLASVARGNVALADHGVTLAEEPLGDVPTGAAARRYRPVLQRGPLTQQGHVLTPGGLLRPFDPDASASAARRFDMKDVSPVLRLWTTSTTEAWLARRDLLESDRFSLEFVVEVEEDGRAHLRFGDGLLGKAPEGALIALYRIGNGRAGNVGAEVLVQPLLSPADLSTEDFAALTGAQGILRARNPLPAGGGIDPEPMEQVRLYAPQAFRSQERTVTDADYAAAAQRQAEVQQAAASRRWTGSWYTIFIRVIRRGGLPVDDAFKATLGAALERVRMAGHDVHFEGPSLVPLDLALKVTVRPEHFRAVVRDALQQALGAGELPDGRRGLFHPDHLAFGQQVYLSQVLSAAMQVPGVAYVQATRFRRSGQTTDHDLHKGLIEMRPLEIPRMDNNPNQPEHGALALEMEGGL